MKKFLLLPLFFAILAACSQNSESSGEQPQRPQYEGDLEKKAKEIYSKEYEEDFYACDLQNKDKALEISKAVEINRVQIEKLSKESKISSNKYKEVLINNIPFLERLNPAQAEDLWYVDTDSWTDTYKLYLSVKDKLDDPKWVWINSSARSLIMEDEDRIVFWTHPWARRELKNLIISTYKKIQNCFQDTTCTKPVLEPDELSWVNLSPGLNDLYPWLDSDKYPIEKRKKFLKSFLNVVAGSAKQFEFRIEQTIYKENSVLVVPINLSVFGSEAWKISSILEKTWNVLGLNLKIKETTDTNAFRIEVSDIPDQRAYVNAKERLMQLYRPSRLTTVAHEFGHVLGLRDEYYTSFNTTSCAYEYQSNDKDLMSSSSTGQVLQSHIDLIKLNYGL